MMNTKKGLWIVVSILIVFMMVLLAMCTIPIVSNFKHGEEVLTDEEHLQAYYNYLSLEYEKAYQEGRQDEFFDSLNVSLDSFDSFMLQNFEYKLASGIYYITRTSDNSKIEITYYCDKMDHTMKFDHRVEIKPSKLNPTTTPRSNQNVK